MEQSCTKEGSSFENTNATNLLTHPYNSQILAHVGYQDSFQVTVTGSFHAEIFKLLVNRRSESRNVVSINVKHLLWSAPSFAKL